MTDAVPSRTNDRCRWRLHAATAALLAAALTGCGGSSGPSRDGPDTTDAGLVDASDIAEETTTDDTVTSDAGDADDDASPPPNLWTRLIGTPSYDRALGVDIDGKGGVYVAGRTQEALGDASFNGGGFDGFVVKFDETGTRQWVRLAGSDQGDVFWDLAATEAGAIYAVGQTNGSVGGSQHRGERDALLVKYDGDGTRQWVRNIGSASNDRARGVATDASGNVYVVGRTSGGFGDATFQGGMWDVFVASFDASGNERWVDIHGSPGNDIAYGAVAGNGSAIYVVGQSNNQLGGKTYGGGSSDAFALRYGTDGSRDWTRLIGGDGVDTAHGAAVSDAGSLVVAGASTAAFGDASYHGGQSDGFLVALDDAGSRQWMQFVGGSGADVLRDVAARPSGGVTLVGTTDGTVDASGNSGATDILIGIVAEEGGDRTVGTSGTAGSEAGLAISHTPAEEFYVAGGTTESIDNQTYNGGPEDALLLRLR